MDFQRPQDVVNFVKDQFKYPLTIENFTELLELPSVHSEKIGYDEELTRWPIVFGPSDSLRRRETEEIFYGIVLDLFKLDAKKFHIEKPLYIEEPLYVVEIFPLRIRENFMNSLEGWVRNFLIRSAENGFDSQNQKLCYFHAVKQLYELISSWASTRANYRTDFKSLNSFWDIFTFSEMIIPRIRELTDTDAWAIVRRVSAFPYDPIRLLQFFFPREILDLEESEKIRDVDNKRTEFKKTMLLLKMEIHGLGNISLEVAESIFG